ncbi:acyltransferase family protein [Raineyella fluvialis]|uniref:Acyltransferase family protein n=1 Tax=Raineyella fluvialis TaxID=2662261 RepID=A0A5Q2FAF9_9ACTN|nr:acyltransferase family protein [Raineyella fluvialis]QGF23902.1 acyltransferase family protein [Raineyella fluvialis]
MDLLRGAVVILVVVYHAAHLQLLSSGDRGGWTVVYALMPFRMPTLLVLSGLLLENSLAKGTGRFVMGKVRGILWPWVIWMAITSIVLRGLNEDPIGYIAIGTHLWFLAVLACAYALALVLRSVPNTWSAAALFVLAGLLQASHGIIPLYLWFAGFFFAGAALSPVIVQWQRAQPIWPIVLSVIGLVGAVRQVGQRTVVTYWPDQIVVSLAGVLSLLWVAHRIPRLAPIRALEWVGRNSIVTYVSHFPLLAPGGVVAMMGLAGISPAATSAGVLSVCIGLTYLRPWTEWLYTMPRWRRLRCRRSLSGQSKRDLPVSSVGHRQA